MNRILRALAVGAGTAIGAAATFTLLTEHATDARSPDFEFDAGGPAREHGAAASAAAMPTDLRATTYRRVAAASRSNIEALVTEAAAERPSVQRTAELEVLLDHFAEFDATAAIGVARRLRLGIELVAPLYGAWYDQDPNAALAGLRAIGDPAEAAAIGLAIDARFALQQDALRRLAEDDALAGLRYVQALPANSYSQKLQQVLAVFYGQQHPNAALAWARNAEGQPGLIAGVLNGIAIADPDRAFDLAVALPPLQRGSAVHAMLMRSVQPGQDTAAMAERLLTLHDAQLKDTGLHTLLQLWGAHQPQQALDWLLENLERVPPQSVRGAAELFASRNPTLAAAQLTRISGDARADWFAGVVQAYGQTDPHEGANWLGQFRNEPGYADAVATLAPQLARTDGAAAARLLETVADSRPQVFRETAIGVIEHWSQQSPPAAAQWVAGIENNRVRSVALPMLAGTWAADDFPAARDWVLRLPSGLERDAALARMLFGSANADAGAGADRAMTDAFSNEMARQQAILHIVAPVAKTDPARARVLLAQYLPDPAQRERVAKLLESIQRERPSMPGPAGDVARTPPPGLGVRPGLPVN